MSVKGVFLIVLCVFSSETLGRLLGNDVVANNKKVILIFCYAVNARLGKHLKTLPDLKNLETYSDSYNWKNQDLVNSKFLNTLKYYAKTIRIDPRDMISQSFYYRASMWLQNNLKYVVMSNTSINDVLKKDIVDKLYLPQYVMETIDKEEMNIRSATDLENFNLNRDNAVQLFYDIGERARELELNHIYVKEQCDQLVNFHEIRCADSKPYEEFLENSPGDFQTIMFEFSKVTLLLLADLAIDASRIDEKPPAVINYDNIDLKNIEKDTVKYFKNVFLLYFRAIQETILKSTTEEWYDFRKTQIENFNEHDTPQKLRLGALIKVGLELNDDYQHEVTRKMNHMDSYTKAHLHRLILWLKYKLDESEMSKKILKTWSNLKPDERIAEHILTKLEKDNETNKFLQIYDNINTLEDLGEMGKIVDEAVVSLVEFTKRDIKDRNPLCKIYKVYEVLLEELDDEKFKNQFKMTPQDMLETIKVTLGNQGNQGSISKETLTNAFYRNAMQSSTSEVHFHPPPAVSRIENKSSTDSQQETSETNESIIEYLVKEVCKIWTVPRDVVVEKAKQWGIIGL